MWQEHYRIIKDYTSWFVNHGTTPQELIDESNCAHQHLETFLHLAGAIPGYCEDPMQKKL